MSCGTPRVYDTFGNTLMVESVNFLASYVILQKGGADRLPIRRPEPGVLQVFSHLSLKHEAQCSPIIGISYFDPKICSQAISRFGLLSIPLQVCYFGV